MRPGQTRLRERHWQGIAQHSLTPDRTTDRLSRTPNGTQDALVGRSGHPQSKPASGEMAWRAWLFSWHARRGGTIGLALLMPAADIGTAVASCGTALGSQHLQLLGRFADRVVLAFDADTAGANAAARLP